MANWQPASGINLGWSCHDCGSYAADSKEIPRINKDCTHKSCFPKSTDPEYTALNCVCECGWVEADAGPIGVYCTNPNCPIEKRIMQSVWNSFLSATGVSRVADNDKVLMISFNRRPTDDEICRIHCQKCNGKGWILLDGFMNVPHACPVCKGKKHT